MPDLRVDLRLDLAIDLRTDLCTDDDEPTPTRVFFTATAAGTSIATATITAI